MYQTSTNYFDLVQETATIVADELAASNERNLSYVKSVWEILGRSTGESVLRSGFEKAEAFVSLTAKEIETSLRSSLDVTEKLIAQSKKMQTQSYESVREIADKALVNAKTVVEAAGERIETLTERVDEQLAETKKKVKAAAAE